MSPTLENPFTPKSAIPTKRLFGGGDENKRRLSQKAKERIESVIKVKYGDLEILKPQAKFLYEMEKELMEEAKKKGKKLSKEEVKKNLTQRIEVDESGNIKKIYLERMELDNLPHLDALMNLELLYCQRNNLTGLPSLNKLKHLKMLDCTLNKLTSLPSLDKLTSLEKLLCSDNELSSLPNLNKLMNLQKMYSDNNKFSEQEKAKIRSQVPKNCEVEIW